MASLKEVKTRIASVNSTRKITSAMKMVASSKLHHAQQAIESMRPYEHQLSHIMSTFVANMEGSIESPYAGSREIKHVAIVVYTSNSSLCGAFNANVVKAFNHKLNDYKKAGIEVVKVYALGKKAADAVAKVGFNNPTDYSTLLDHPSYEKASDIATEIMDLYTTGQIDKAELIYHHFKSAGSQILTEETFLPIELDTTSNNNQEGNKQAIDFIAEPSKEDVIAELIPKSLHLKLFTALLDSLASEHAARVIAMQAATDNADDLLRELTLTYNKTRQQAITSELLDIVGGSMQ